MFCVSNRFTNQNFNHEIIFITPPRGFKSLKITFILLLFAGLFFTVGCEKEAHFLPDDSLTEQFLQSDAKPGEIVLGAEKNSNSSGFTELTVRVNSVSSNISGWSVEEGIRVDSCIYQAAPGSAINGLYNNRIKPPSLPLPSDEFVITNPYLKITTGFINGNPGFANGTVELTLILKDVSGGKEDLISSGTYTICMGDNCTTSCEFQPTNECYYWKIPDLTGNPAE